MSAFFSISVDSAVPIPCPALQHPCAVAPGSLKCWPPAVARPSFAAVLVSSHKRPAGYFTPSLMRSNGEWSIRALNWTASFVLPNSVTSTSPLG